MSIASLLALVLVTASAGVVRPQAQDPAQTLRGMIRSYETAWNAHDAAAIAAYFTDDADQIMTDGPTTVGRDALGRYWAARFKVMEPERKITLTVTAIRIVTPVVAVINTVATTGGRTAQGKALAPSTDRGTWVVVQKNGRWLIAALRVYPTEQATPK